MDKKTLTAIILSVIVVAGSFVVQGILWPTKDPVASPAKEQPEAKLDAEAVKVQPSEITINPETNALLPDQNFPIKDIVIETELVKIVIASDGADVKSYLLKTHKDQGHPVEMINLSRGTGRAFEINFGSYENQAPIRLPFNVAQKGEYNYEFSRTFLGQDGVPFLLKKSYRVYPHEYLIELEVTIESTSNAYPQISQDKSYAYTLTFGPQMGPAFQKLDGNYEYRKYYRFAADKRDDVNINNETKTFEDGLKWAAIAGKYFAIIGIPDGTIYQTVWSNKKATQTDEPSKLGFSRPTIKSSKNSDLFRFYVGPKDEKELAKYSSPENNAAKTANLKLEQVLDTNPFLWWLEVGLKWIMQLFYYGVGMVGLYNWGIAIVLLTVLVKVVTWPLTHKSYESIAAMQAIQPKIQEIQAKYKSDPQKLNASLAEIYKKEGVNPLGGCLPMLLQLPIFFALYSMFSTHFDLRGAMFIPGWIPDLSAPEFVWSWGDFQLPFLGWNALRLLPFLMVGTQIWTSLLSQPAGAPTGQSKLLIYALPLVFFFFLYEMPSGLLIYWTITNVLTALQQWYINTHLKNKAPLKKRASSR